MNGKGIKTGKTKIAALLVAGLMVVGAATSFAYGPYSSCFNEGSGGGFFQTLNLNDQQEKEVRKITRDSQTKRDDIRDKYHDSRKAERQDLDNLRASTNEAISGVLDENQRAKFKEISDRRDDNRMEERGYARMDGRRGGHMRGNWNRHMDDRGEMWGRGAGDCDGPMNQNCQNGCDRR